MITNLLPVEATHSSLDLFEKPPLLITFDYSFEQKIGPAYSPNGPNLEFEVTGDRNNFIDLQRIYLELKCRILNSDNTILKFTRGDAPNTDAAQFVNNALHSMFSDCTVTANGLKISNANGLYGHKSFIETEFSNNSDAKRTWLHCQGYKYEDNPNDFTGNVFTTRQAAARLSAVVTFYGKLPVDVFSCDKHLLSGVTLRIAFLRAQNDFITLSEDDAKHYKVQIVEANLYVRKMVVNDNVVAAIERTLLKSPAIYRYNEVIAKTFLATNGQRNWKHEDVFMKEPIRRLAIAMNTNRAFVGSHRDNPFWYRKFDLSEITVYRNGLPIAGTPMSTVDNKRVYFNTIGSLAYIENGHGIPLDDYENHFVMVFDLTSTQEASHDFLHPELTNASISLELKFGSALTDNIEILLLGEKTSTIYINSDRNVSKNTLLASSANG